MSDFIEWKMEFMHFLLYLVSIIGPKLWKCQFLHALRSEIENSISMIFLCHIDRCHWTVCFGSLMQIDEYTVRRRLIVARQNSSRHFVHRRRSTRSSAGISRFIWTDWSFFVFLLVFWQTMIQNRADISTKSSSFISRVLSQVSSASSIWQH